MGTIAARLEGAAALGPETVKAKCYE